MISLEQFNMKLLNRNAYFAYFLLGTKKMVTDIIPTAAVGFKNLNQIVLYINPTFWENLKNDEERSWIFHHEVLHLVYGHLYTGDNYQFKHVFNIAADLYINQQIGETNAPQGALFPKMFNFSDGLSTQQYYDLVLNAKNQNLKSIANKLKNGEPFEQGEDGYMTNHHFNPEEFEFSEKDSAEERAYKETAQELLKNQLKRVYKENEEKLRGLVPGDFSSNFSEEIKPAQISWKRILKQFVATKISNERIPTRKWPSKYHPEYTSKTNKLVSNIWVVLDTSGSVSNEELSLFFSEIHAIHKNEKVGVTIVETDAKVNKVYEYNGTLPSYIHGRGGTQMSPGIEHVNKSASRGDLLIVFTDGGIEPNPTEAKIPTLWVITPNGSESFNTKSKKLKLN